MRFLISVTAFKGFNQTMDNFKFEGPDGELIAERAEANSLKLDLQQMRDIHAELAEVYRRLALASSNGSWIK